MTVVLIDNGSLEPAATVNLRATAAALSARTSVAVHPVSWKHSARIPGGADVLAPFVLARVAAGEREFLFVPFFISEQGAIGSALRADLEKLQASVGPFSISFTAGLASSGAIPPILAARIRETIAARALVRPTVIVVDHGGPSAASAALRDQLAAETRALLGPEISTLAAASMEGGEHAHTHPLLAAQLRVPGFSSGDVVIAPLFLSPGRHAGPDGDLAQLAVAAVAESPALRPHFTGLVGTHPLALAAITLALRTSLSR